MNPKLIYILLRQLLGKMTNEEKREKLSIAIIVVVAIIFLLLTFIYYILISPLSVLSTLLGVNSSNLDIIKSFKKEYAKEVFQNIDLSDISFEYLPYLSQRDNRWASVPYAGGTIYSSGCGVTALSIIIAGAMGEITEENNPLAIANYATQMGWAIDGIGTSWALMTEGAKHYGVIGEQVGTSEEDILVNLAQGKPMILSMTPESVFTNTGHFIVLVGIAENNQIKVYDPYSERLSYLEPDFVTHHISDLAYPKSKGAWAYSLEINGNGE